MLRRLNRYGFGCRNVNVSGEFYHQHDPCQLTVDASETRVINQTATVHLLMDYEEILRSFLEEAPAGFMGEVSMTASEKTSRYVNAKICLVAMAMAFLAWWRRRPDIRSG